MFQGEIMTNDYQEREDNLPEEAGETAVTETAEIAADAIQKAEGEAADTETVQTEGTEGDADADQAAAEPAPADLPDADWDATEEESEQPDEETKEERWRRRRKELIGDVVFFIISFIVIFTVFKLFPPYRVSGDSMNMTLKDKAFGFGTIFFTPDYGDIVVLHGDEGKTNESDFIKRVIGKPGDVLDITDGVVVRNGEELKEDYVYFDPDYTYRTGMTQHIELGEGEYLVLGDNRYHSMDGRYFGAIKKSEMKCKMLFFLWGKKR